MSTPRQVVRTVSRPTIVAPLPIPSYIAPTTTVPQPNLGPNVGPVPLFAAPKPKSKPILKNPLFFVAVAAVAWYLFG